MGTRPPLCRASFIEAVRKGGKAVESVITSGCKPHCGRQRPAGSEVITAARDPPRPLSRLRRSRGVDQGLDSMSRSNHGTADDFPLQMLLEGFDAVRPTMLLIL